MKGSTGIWRPLLGIAFVFILGAWFVSGVLPNSVELSSKAHAPLRFAVLKGVAPHRRDDKDEAGQQYMELAFPGPTTLAFQNCVVKMGEATYPKGASIPFEDPGTYRLGFCETGSEKPFYQGRVIIAGSPPAAPPQ